MNCQLFIFYNWEGFKNCAIVVSSILINFKFWPIVLAILSYTAISDYKQSLQFQNLNQEKRNIHMEVYFFGFMCFILLFFISTLLGYFILGFAFDDSLYRLLEVAEELRYLYMTLLLVTLCLLTLVIRYMFVFCCSYFIYISVGASVIVHSM